MVTASHDDWPANLLVVFLLVRPYKLGRGKSRGILSRAREENPRPSKETRLQPGGHDLIRFLSATLAADRGRSPYHRHNVAPHLRCVRLFNGETGKKSGQTNVKCPVDGSFHRHVFEPPAKPDHSSDTPPEPVLDASGDTEKGPGGPSHGFL